MGLWEADGSCSVSHPVQATPSTHPHPSITYANSCGRIGMKFQDKFMFILFRNDQIFSLQLPWEVVSWKGQNFLLMIQQWVTLQLSYQILHDNTSGPWEGFGGHIHYPSLLPEGWAPSTAKFFIPVICMLHPL